jgi:hypothetical protein
MEQLRLPIRKKLRYVPGMISLLTVPFLFLYYGNGRIEEIPDYRIIKLNYPCKSPSSKYCVFYEKPPSRQYLDINLTSNQDSNYLRMQFGVLYMREINLKKDSVHGVVFHYSEKTTYDDFVKLLDLFEINDLPIYYPIDYGMVLYYKPPRRHRPNEKILPAPAVLSM